MDKIAEMEDLRNALDAVRYERMKYQVMFDRALRTLASIHALLHPENTVANGKTYVFHPPDALVREMWEGLSNAIREIDIDALRDESTVDVNAMNRPWV